MGFNFFEWQVIYRTLLERIENMAAAIRWEEEHDGDGKLAAKLTRECETMKNIVSELEKAFVVTDL